MIYRLYPYLRAASLVRSTRLLVRLQRLEIVVECEIQEIVHNSVKAVVHPEAQR